MFPSKPIRNEELINFYLKGNSLRETGSKFDLTYQRVDEILRLNNISKRKVGNGERKEEII